MSAFRSHNQPIDYRNYPDHPIYKLQHAGPDNKMTEQLTKRYIAETSHDTDGYKKAARKARATGRPIPTRQQVFEGRIAETFARRQGEDQAPVFDPLRWNPDVAMQIHRQQDSNFDRAMCRLVDRDNRYGISEVEAVSAFIESKFNEELNRNIELGAQRVCELASFGLSNCVDTINVGCQNRILTTRPNIGDYLRNAKRMEATRYFKLDDVNCVQFLKPNKYKIAIAWCAEDLCNALWPLYMQMINNLGVMDMIRKERQLSDLFFNMGPIDSDGIIHNRYPFIYNNAMEPTYIPVGHEDAPWQNLIQGDPFATGEGGPTFPCPTHCNIDLMTMLDKLEEDRTDLSGTCLPVDCDKGEKQIIAMSDQAARRLRTVMAPKSVELCITRADGCKGTQTTQEPGRTDIDVKQSKWARQRYRNFLTANCGLSRSQANSYIECTWWYGSPRAFAGWAVEWEFRTYDRGQNIDNFASQDTVNVTSEFFDKEFLFRRKFMGKANAIVLDPTCGYLMQALPGKEDPAPVDP